jgi:hypothetical protein
MLLADTSLAADAGPSLQPYKPCRLIPAQTAATRPTRKAVYRVYGVYLFLKTFPDLEIL